MGVTYDFGKRPPANGGKDDERLYVRWKSNGKVDFDTLTNRIVSSSGLSKGDVIGVMAMLEEELVRSLQEGCSVQLGNIGYFSPKLKARAVTDRSEIRAGSIRVTNVNFRSSAWLRKKVDTSVERAVWQFNRSSTSSREEHVALLDNYLETHSFITASDYCALTGLLRNKALRELHALVDEGRLDTEGKAPHLLFVKKQ